MIDVDIEFSTGSQVLETGKRIRRIIETKSSRTLESRKLTADPLVHIPETTRRGATREMLAAIFCLCTGANRERRPVGLAVGDSAQGRSSMLSSSHITTWFETLLRSAVELGVIGVTSHRINASTLGGSVSFSYPLRLAFHKGLIHTISNHRLMYSPECSYRTIDGKPRPEISQGNTLACYPTVSRIPFDQLEHDIRSQRVLKTRQYVVARME